MGSVPSIDELSERVVLSFTLEGRPAFALMLRKLDLDHGNLGVPA
jgi:hypothetical protein